VTKLALDHAWTAGLESTISPKRCYTQDLTDLRLEWVATAVKKDDLMIVLLNHTLRSNSERENKGTQIGLFGGI
jgi:hypothetical protein